MLFLSVYLGFIITVFKITLFHRSVCLPRNFPTHLSVFPGLEVFDSLAAPAAVNAGISLSMVLNVQVPCQLTVLCTWVVLSLLTLTVSAILRVTATTSTKARYAWDSGSVTVMDMEMLTPILVGSQCRGSISRKSPNLKLRF